jgi:hypothetical protein
MSTFWKKALEAAGWTFLEVFIVTFAASMAALGDLTWEGLAPAAASAVLAAVGAAISIVKSLVVRNIGAEDSTLISG